MIDDKPCQAGAGHGYIGVPVLNIALNAVDCTATVLHQFISSFLTKQVSAVDPGEKIERANAMNHRMKINA